MIVCVCNNVSDKEINKKIDNHYEPIKSVEQLKKCMKICNNCECCYFSIKDVLDKKNGEVSPEPELESVFDLMKKVT